MTLKRMAKRDPEFPKTMLFGNKYFVVEHEWENYKRILMQRSMHLRELSVSMKSGGSPGRPRKTPAQPSPS